MNQKNKPKIAIIGAGAVGSLIGGLLFNAGENVTLIGRKNHINTIKQKGLFINGVQGEFTVHIHAQEKLDFEPDLIFLTVKLPDLKKTCQEIIPYVRQTPIVTFQNGITGDALVGSILGEKQLYSGIILFNAFYLKPGQVTFGFYGPIIIGKILADKNPFLVEIKEILNKIIKTTISEHIQGAKRTKLLINSMGNAIEAMTGMSISQVINLPGISRIALLILKESLQTLKKANIKPAPLPGISISSLNLLLKMPLPFAARILKKEISRKGNPAAISSTLQSIRKGKTTEIEYLNGEIVRLGKSINLLTPINSKIVQLVHSIEKNQQFIKPQQLLNTFSNLNLE